MNYDYDCKHSEATERGCRGNSKYNYLVKTCNKKECLTRCQETLNKNQRLMFKKYFQNVSAQQEHHSTTDYDV